MGNTGMMHAMTTLLGTAAAVAMLAAAPADATSFTLTLTGNVADFTQSQQDFGGLHFDDHFLALSGLDASNAITVAQGDTIGATVTLDTAYTIPASMVRTDLLQYFFGNAFPNENTGVTGTFNFFDGATLVRTFGYGSTTSGQLASFAAVFPPDNIAFTFDSFTNDLTITDLVTPATLDRSSFRYSLVSGGSTTVPEPATWALMLAGLGAVGGVMRRRQAVVAT